MTHRKSNGTHASRRAILRQLGHGNLTRVFLAAPRASAPRADADRSIVRGDPVVLKLLHPELARDGGFRALFMDQAASTLSLRHPNLVRTLDVIVDSDAHGVALEFLAGQTLARVIERVGRQRFPVDLHLHILLQVLNALVYSHELQYHERSGVAPGCLHGDVGPNNVFITYDGQVKLLGAGFGEAMRALESRLGRPLRDVKYAAPEVLLGYPSEPSSDSFGVAVMIWEAVARQARTRSDDMKGILRRRTSGEEPALESAWADAPEPLIALCSRALNVNQHERHATVRAFRAELEAYLGRAAERSDAVLARLPELMQSSFATEREQMQLFIGTRLARADDRSLDVALGDEELTPHREGGTAAGLRAATAQRDGLSSGATDGVRTGLRRARPEIIAAGATTGVHERGRPSAGPLPPASSHRHSNPDRAQAPEWASRASRWLGPVSRLYGGYPERHEPLASASEPRSQEATTAGHRAYSSTLERASHAPRGTLRPSADVLGATALLIGSLVATYSIYRHAQRAERPEPASLAIQADLTAPGSPRSAGVAPAPASAGAASARVSPSAHGGARTAPDAGAEPVEVAAPTSAFFDGQSAANAQDRAPPRLRPEQLPAVDPELRSLQDAIVTAAKTRRLGTGSRREKKAEPARPVPAATVAPRPIDDTDPYSEPAPP